MGMLGRWFGGTLHDPVARLVPQRIELTAIDSIWAVDWRPGAVDGLLVSRPQTRITLGQPQALDAVASLQHWLKAEARRHLPEWLSLVARDTGHRYQRVSVRLQRSRWGSCSSRGTISLNARLLLLPPDAVRYVLVHELCHTLHMNHSRAFWDEVARHQPDWRHRVGQIRALQQDLPAWSRLRPA